MSDRVDFEIVYPNGPLVFHCNTCDANWTRSHEDIANSKTALEAFKLAVAGRSFT